MRFIASIALLSALMVTGCVQPSPTSTAAPKPTGKPAETGGAEIKPAAPAPKPAPAPPAKPVRSAELVANPGFEEWEEGLPKGWKADKKQVARAEGSAPDTGAIEIKESKDYVMLVQNVSTVAKGKKVLVRAKVKSDTDRGLVLKCIYYVGAELKTERKDFGGLPDKWKNVSMEFVLPAGASHKSFDVQLLRSPGVKGRVLFDEVSVTTEK